MDVNLYGYGPGVHHFCGNLDNTEIGLKLAKMKEWDINEITQKLQGQPTKP